jgi:hypothetical protein
MNEEWNESESGNECAESAEKMKERERKRD